MSNGKSGGNALPWILGLVIVGLGVYWFNDPKGFEKHFRGLFKKEEKEDPNIQLRKDIIGSWRQEDDKNVAIITYKQDGTFSIALHGKGSAALIIAFNNAIGAEIHGTWAINDETLTMQFLGVTNPLMDAVVRLIAAHEGGDMNKVTRAKIVHGGAAMFSFDNGKTMEKVKQ
jgi:hypothetical protein